MKIFVPFKWVLLLLICNLSFDGITGQIVVTQPLLPTDNVAVKITFDATQGNAALKDYIGDVYAHTGVITDKSSEWRYVKTTWGTNTEETKLTRISANIYEFNIAPNVRQYYGVPADEKILKLAFVFRSSNSQKQGKDEGNKDIFTNIYEDKFIVAILNSTNAHIKPVNSDLIINAATSDKASLSMLLNGSVIKSLSDTTKINDTITFTNPGDYWIKVTGTSGSETAADSIFVTVYDALATSPIPAGMKDGINYIDNTTATLVLYAPQKQNAYLIGDFNNWIPSGAYQMKKDGDRFWYTLQDLTPQKEYLFQYIVDGSIRIADPYADKVSDPNYDKEIPATTYPGLIAYPALRTTEIASVIQTGQTVYSWQHPTYDVPKKEDLIIYELLIRDFTTEGTIKAAKEKIPYLKNLGINTIELMPINEFEGNNSWGYNPNFYFAPDKAYGTKNDYKEFIDACHANGIIVLQDIVLNHAYGTSPLVRLYWDNTENKPAANSPWFNVESPNSTYSWGYDFNHESTATRQLVDSVARYWMSEYKIDGFRYDFVKGFTNTPGDGGAYDAPRIANLKRMADVVWAANPNAYIILELFAPNTEEKELAEYNKGMLIWGNANNAFGEAIAGNTSNSDFSNAAAATRGYTVPGLVSYMESHDEERNMYKALTYGKSGGLYNIKDKNTALKRTGAASVFFFSIPGPKMIWQFGELGYDISINYIERTAKKPVHWEYLQDSARYNFVYKVDSTMISLRKQYPVFTSRDINMSVSGALKRINLSDNDLKVTLLGNFDVYSGLITPEFQQTGTWYEYFTGKTLEVTNTTQKLTLQPGEYRLYTSKKLSGSPNPTGLNDLNENADALVYPNPANSFLFITVEENSGTIELLNASGQKVLEQAISKETTQLAVDNLKPGLYIVRIINNGNTAIKKFIKE